MVDRRFINERNVSMGIVTPVHSQCPPLTSNNIFYYENRLFFQSSETQKVVGIFLSNWLHFVETKNSFILNQKHEKFRFPLQPLFNGSVPVRVQLHQNLKVRVRFGFIETKLLRFRFGSGSLNPNFKGSGLVRVHRKKAVFTGSRFRFGFTSKSLIWPKTKLGCYISKITKYKLHASIN